ncbi:hypothetical protein C8R46DRAFT_1084943 [Mycena filopes]|nr:hypothetical protein C8R46DRAFT_1084943 [Mycena filopes]
MSRPRLVPYVLIEGSPRRPIAASPRKRKASLSPSPCPSSRAPSPNPSPAKKIRGERDVEVTTHRLSDLDFKNHVDRGESPTVSVLELAALGRPASPTVSELAGPASDDLPDEIMSVDEPESSITAADDAVFQFEKDVDCVEEDRLSQTLHETPGDGLPIRRLRDFTLYKRDNMQPFSATELLQEDLPLGIYAASGLVSSVKADDDSEDGDEDSDRVQLLPLVGFNVHDFDEETADEVDERIFVKTSRAWYILDTAARIYRPLWIPFLAQHQLTHRVLTRALNDPPTTYAQFFQSLTSQDKATFESDDAVAYVHRAIYRAIDSRAPIESVPLIRHLIGQELESASEGNSSEEEDDTSGDPSSDEEEEVLSKKVASHNLERKNKANLDPNTQNYITPRVARAVMKHWISPVSVVGAGFEEANATLANELHEVLEHHGDPAKITWIDHLNEPGYYSSVKMDGVVYKIGDVVAVAAGGDDNAHRADSEDSAKEHCVNKFANNVWFCQINYFFDHCTQKEKDKPRRMLHGHWFSHGSRTILQEVTHTQELFLLHECDDIPVATIFQKCDVRFLKFDETEEADQFNPEARSYFCQLTYDDQEHEFTDLPTEEERKRLSKALTTHDPKSHCLSCRRKDELELYCEVHRVDDGLALHGRVYHAQDFVYVKPALDAKTGLCLFIAQVVSVNFETEQLQVRYYERHPDDTRQIYRTRRKNWVAVVDLDGQCFVRHLDPEQPQVKKEIERWIEAHTDNFYTHYKQGPDGELITTGEDEFAQCDACFDAHYGELQEKVQLLEDLLKYTGQNNIPVLEVFSGAGGLSQGLDQSKFFKTKWAVERSVPAAETFRLNHPETKVLCIDINDLVRHTADLRDKKEPQVLRSADKARTPISPNSVPPLEDGKGPGVVCGGPPCQSFSSANGNKREDDPRSTLPFTMLSVAEVYQPNFFLLENVTGLLQHSVSDREGGEVEKIMLKLIVRGLIALGYQVRFKILQAGQYGAPQFRQRLIFFGAKRGCKLPEFPVPTHAFPKAAGKHKLFIKDDFIPPVRRGRGPDDDHIFAPHATVTVEDAIGDLPPFDWINPHKIVAKTPEDEANTNDRVADGIEQFDPSDAPVGFREPVAYLTPPKTRYQRAMRRGNPEKVNYHVTASASSAVAEASGTVPLRPLANHRELPEPFFQASALDPHSKAVCYGRLDAEGYFKTAVTQCQPRSRGSYLLHPSQKRAVSVVEAKRAQGFPDDYILWSDKQRPSTQVADYYRHIGNAVPVPLAAALGRSLEAAFVETAKRLTREASPSP